MNDKYAGMTVNERLFTDGLIHKFDKAVQEKNVAEVISILKAVEFTDETIQPILKELKLI